VWTFIGQIAVQSGIDAQQSGTIFAIATLLGVAGAGSASLIGRRLPRARLLLAGFAMMMAAMLLLLNNPALARFASAALLFKFSWTFILPFILATLADIDHSGKLMNATNLVIGGGLAIGPALAGQLIAANGGSLHAVAAGHPGSRHCAGLVASAAATPHHPCPRLNTRRSHDIRTAFYFDELCMWHSAGLHALTLPVGGWVQPPAAAGHAESPETKRRLKNLLDVAGISRQLQQCTAEPASREDLLRVHGAAYLDEFKRLSDAGGGELGPQAPVGPGSYDIACLSAGLPSPRWMRCGAARWPMPMC
jgi:MFS family permease